MAATSKACRIRERGVTGAQPSFDYVWFAMEAVAVGLFNSARETRQAKRAGCWLLVALEALAAANAGGIGSRQLTCWGRDVRGGSQSQRQGCVEAIGAELGGWELLGPWEGRDVKRVKGGNTWPGVWTRLSRSLYGAVKLSMVAA